MCIAIRRYRVMMDYLEVPQEQHKPEKVRFYPEQVRYLEKLFPVTVHSAIATEATMRYYNGQQSVLQAIKERMR